MMSDNLRIDILILLGVTIIIVVIFFSWKLEVKDAKYKRLTTTIEDSVVSHKPTRLTDNVYVIPLADGRHQIVNIKEVVDGMVKQTKGKTAPKENSGAGKRN